MADTTALKNRIKAAIKANSNQEITGPVLQQALLDIVDELDLNPELENEAQQRQTADTRLDNLITGIKNNIDGGINPYLLNNYVYGNGNELSVTDISGLIHNHTYRFWLYPTTWDAPNPHPGAFGFVIYYGNEASDIEKQFIAIASAQAPTNTREYAEFKYDESYGDIHVAGRAIAGSKIHFFIQDVTDTIIVNSNPLVVCSLENGKEVANFDTTNGTLTFGTDPLLYYHGKRYSLPSEPIEYKTLATSVPVLIYNTINGTCGFKESTSKTTDGDVVLAFIRKKYGENKSDIYEVSACFNYSIDNADVEDKVLAVEALTGRSFSFNGSNQTALTRVEFPECIFLPNTKYRVRIKCDKPIYSGESEDDAMLQCHLRDNNDVIKLFIANLSKTLTKIDVDVKVVTGNYYSKLVTFNRLSDTSVVTIEVIKEDIAEKVTDDYLYKAQHQIEMASSLGVYTNEVFPIKNLVFAHISDTHSSTVTYNDQNVATQRPERIEPLNKVIEVFNEISKNADKNNYYGKQAKFIIHTGDIKYATSEDDFNHFVTISSKTDKPIFVVVGNHDVGNNSRSPIKAWNDSQIYNQMIKPFIGNWNIHSDTSTLDKNYTEPHPEGKNYYYTDFTTEKVRLIVLYEYETDYELSDNMLVYAHGYRAFSQAQLNWFAKTLLTTPEGYGVLVAKHQPENFNGSSDNNFNAYHGRGHAGYQQTRVSMNMIADIVEAFIDGETINKNYSQRGGIVTTLTANYDFSGKNANTEFIAYLSGHTHNDQVSFLRDYPKQLELNVGACNTWYYDGCDVPHENNTISEVLMNVYSIDRNRGYVYIVRIGADYTCMGQKRDAVAIKYRTDTV